MKKLLLVIDPQIDFCDIPKDFIQNCAPALPVFGAHDDMLRLSTLIKNYDFSDVIISLDTHDKFDIAHPSWWVDEHGKHPDPFTRITASNVYQNVWVPLEEDKFWYAYDYLNALEEQNKYMHIIWPEHCIAGTPGQKVHPSVQDSLNEWETRSNKLVEYIEKGKNPLTEHYSLFKAEIPIDEDDSTQINDSLMSRIATYDFVFVGGEALSHCVKSSVMDLLDYVHPEKIVFLIDTSSAVQGFEEEAKEFIKLLKEKGVILMTTKELMF